jgi:ubiquinone/menaquinone biosynthesis C-methylase UbiE
MYQKEYWERETVKNRRSAVHPVVEAYVSSKMHAINQYITFSKEAKVLDVGCGNGHFLYFFDGHAKAYGIDYSESMLRLNPAKKISLMDANCLAFDDNSFDIVFCHQILHHVTDIKNVINEMSRVSKKYVIIVEPNRNNPLSFLFALIVKEERNLLRFSIPYLKNRVCDCNLSIVAAFSHGIIFPNMTPRIILPLLKKVDCRYSLANDNIIIAEKN